MKREMGLKKVSEDDKRNDGSSDSDRETPVDLRIRCVIERETKAKDNQTKNDRNNQNMVLTSLLQRNVIGTLLSPQKENVKNCNYTNSKSLWYSEDEQLRNMSLKINCDSEEGYTRSDFACYGQNDPLLHIKLKHSPSHYALNKRDILENSYAASPTAYIHQPVEFHSTKDMPSAFRRISKHETIGKTLNPIDSNAEKESKEFVPNYRKFYSKCSNLSQTPKAKIKLVLPVQTHDDLGHYEENCASGYGQLSLVNRLSGCSLVLPNPSLRTALASTVNSRSEYFRKQSRHYEHDGERRLEDTVQCLKRKLTCPTRDLTRESGRKDSTLRCLLETSMNEKRVNSKHSDKFINSSTNNGRNENDCGKVTQEGSHWRDAQQTGSKDACRENSDRSLSLDHKYYSRVLQSSNQRRENGVLRSLLVADPKVPTQIVQTPPISGSPGSESTSSGSTDSGVYSDNPVEDPNLIRRRVSRALTGKHVKSGTGASLSTLRILRQMIEKRRQKNDRKH